MEKIQKLIGLINENGKHSSYQQLPSDVRNNYSKVLSEVNWSPSRLDIPRLNWIVDVMKSIKVGTITDIGANSGFFSVELRNAFDASCISYEPHLPHAKAIGLIKEICAINDFQLAVKNAGVSLNDVRELNNSDLLVFLNVLHHAGDDFDSDKVKTIKDWKTYSSKYLEQLTGKFKYMFFQLGNAWMGSGVKLFDDRTCFSETINLLENSGWKVECAGLIENFIGNPKYNTYFRNSNSNQGFENLNEIYGARKLKRYCSNKLFLNVDYKFLNRPLYLCKSKVLTA